MANYRVTELDFDAIKNNLKTFLTNYRDKNNNLVFSDYDFEASSISILLDILAYNTHYNAYLASMVANEMFLDSAVKRESAVSIAKHLGYTPLSYRSAKAKVDFVINDPEGSPPFITLPRYSPFTTTIEGIQYTFVNLDSVTIRPSGGIYRFTDITIVEGEPLSYTYRVDISGPSEKYSIPNKNIDTSTIRVRVQNSYTDLTTSTFTLAEDFAAVTPNSKVFFLEENASGFFEIYFGDGVLGQKLSPGNLVLIDYLVSNGSVCNVSGDITQTFILGRPVGGVTLSSPIVAKENSTGGDEGDTIDEIKFKAPKFLSSYNRAVTAEDYKAIIEANFPLVESISVWGGEENDPPFYGKVMISLKPYLGYTINDLIKNRIKTEILASKKMMAIIPEFIDPNYLYLNLDTTVKFNQRNSKYNAQQIQVLVRAEIEKYFSQELQKFDRDFFYSKLSRAIDSVDPAIDGNTTLLKLQKRISPLVNTRSGYADNASIKFVNSLISGTIRSTGFFYEVDNIIKSVYMKDVLTEGSTSILSIYDFFTNSLLAENVGTVNYTTGIVSIPLLSIAGYFENSDDIRIYAETNNLDIVATKDVILVIDDSTQDVNLKRDPGLTIDVLTNY